MNKFIFLSVAFLKSKVCVSVTSAVATIASPCKDHRYISLSVTAVLICLFRLVQSSSPELLQKKVKVISRCQDAVKAMSDDRKFSGRLSVKLAPEQRTKADVKFQSPLRRIPIVRFQFTTPAKTTEETDGFALALDKILQKVGVLKDVVDLEELVEALPASINSSFVSSFADEDTAALKLSSKKFEVRSECEECRRRKAKSFAEVGSQCADNKDTVTISTQVTEEDLNPKPKNDSIAYLTPAQLLGKGPDKGPTTPEKMEKKESPVMQPPMRKEKPKPNAFKGRGGFRKTLRDRPGNNYYDYDYEYEEDFDYYDRTQAAFEDPRESFGNRFAPPPARFQRQQQFAEEELPMHRVNQFRESEGNFTDFTQPFRGRGRLQPRFN